MNESINKSLHLLQYYIEKEGYKGYDPYDALNSPIFKLPILKNSKIIRFVSQQLVKRLPFSVRRLLNVPKGYNPVTLGLSIQAYAYLSKAEPEKKRQHLKRLDFLVKELETVISKGYSGACWGYDFDWEARHAKLLSYQPTIVATGIITNSLFIAYKLTGHKDAARLVISAADFVIKDLNRTYNAESFCFSYSPYDKQQVFNASMKGVRILVQAYSLSGIIEYKSIAKQAVDFVIGHQKENGSWDYSLAKSGRWSDNYHTGYVLDCLDEYQKLSDDVSYISNIRVGYSFYINNFVTDEGVPKFYYNKLYPIDCTAASQSILTCIRFGDINAAIKVAKWMTTNMQKENGSYKFRIFRYYTISTSFMRWSDAWMFAALSNLKYINV